jgi:hypothetical protein
MLRGAIAARSDALGAACAEPGAELRPLPLRCAIKALARCGCQTCVMLAQRRIRQPTGWRGRSICFADGTDGTVYRETVSAGRPPASPAVLVVCFRLRHVRAPWAHALFRLESELNTVLFAGFAGFRSKLWLSHDRRGVYRGVYQWDDPQLAVAYVRALWWALAAVSEKGSIHYAVLPGLDRDEVLGNPEAVDDALRAAPGGWWRPVKEEGDSG